MGRTVRVLDKNPVYHNRTGTVIKVDGDVLHIRFTGDTRIIAGFTIDMVEIFEASPANNLHELGKQLANDMECWVHEACAAYHIAKKKK